MSLMHPRRRRYLRCWGFGRHCREALELIRKENPFPAVGGRVCARFCEEACTRGSIDAPVTIDEVKRYIAELELQHENRYIPQKLNDRGHRIAVIGAGPAGLSCAYYLAILGHQVTVFEKQALPGGMMQYGIPSFRLEKQLIAAEIEVLKTLGVEIRCGAQQVDLYCLEGYDEMPCGKDERTEAEQEGVKIHAGWGPMKITETDITFKKCVRVKDGEGRFAPAYDESETVTAQAEAVFCSIGQRAEWGGLPDGLKVQLNRSGTAQADSWIYQTSEPDVFVGGDIYTGAKFVIHTIAAGKEGADSLHRYVWEGHSLTLDRVRRDNFHMIDKDNLAPIACGQQARQKPAIDAAKACTFRDERGVLTPGQIQTETSRCLGCGAARVDPNICIGCSLCTTRCKFDAIHLSRVYDAWGVPYEKLVGHVLKENIKKAGRVLTGKRV